MSSAQPLVDSRTAQRLRARRVLVVDSRRDRAEAFAQRLNSAGASAVAVSADHGPHAAVHALDADVMLVNEDEPEACRALVIALRRHPRTRWATVLPGSFSALWPPGALQPDIAAMAEELSRLAESLMELSVRARGKLPYETALEPLGANRILRVLDNTGRKVQVVLSDGPLHAELELGDHRISRVRAIGKDARPLVDVEALALVLTASSGRVRIEEGGAPGPASWTAALGAGLEAAAALACARMVPGEEPAPPAASGVRPAVTERSVAGGDSEAEAREYHATVPQITLAEVFDEADPISARIHSDLPGEPELSAPAERPSSRPTVQVTAAPSVPPPNFASGPTVATPAPARRGVRAVMVIAALVVAGGATAVLWRAAPPPWHRAAQALAARLGASAAPDTREQAQPAPQGATAAAPDPQAPGDPALMAATAVPAAPAAVAAHTPTAVPATATAPPAESAAPAADPPAARAPTARELKQARSLTLRGHGYLRADRPETAAKAYLKALALAPDHAPAIAGLARIHLDDANAIEARRWAERLAALQPNDGNAQLLLGDAYELSGNAAGADAAWRRATELGNTLARKRLAPR